MSFPGCQDQVEAKNSISGTCEVQGRAVLTGEEALFVMKKAERGFSGAGRGFSEAEALFFRKKNGGLNATGAS